MNLSEFTSILNSAESDDNVVWEPDEQPDNQVADSQDEETDNQVADIQDEQPDNQVADSDNQVADSYKPVDDSEPTFDPFDESQLKIVNDKYHPAVDVDLRWYEGKDGVYMTQTEMILSGIYPLHMRLFREHPPTKHWPKFLTCKNSFPQPDTPIPFPTKFTTHFTQELQCFVLQRIMYRNRIDAPNADEVGLKPAISKVDTKADKRPPSKREKLKADNMAPSAFLGSNDSDDLRGFSETDNPNQPSLFVSIMQYVIKGLEKVYHVRLVSDYGDFGGFSVYQQKTSNSPFQTPLAKELNYPDNFTYWDKWEHTAKNCEKLAKMVRDLDYEPEFKWCFESKDSLKILQAMVMSICSGLAYCSKKADTDVSIYAMSMPQPELTDFAHSVSVIGSGYAPKFIPPSEWFPESVKSLSPLDLLSIFPKNEAESLMLSLGRVCVGKRGTTITEMADTLQHTYRTMSLIVGIHPGLGKSWLFNDALIPTLKMFGYQVASFNLAMSEFSFAEPALADLVFVDDLTKDSQSKILHSAIVKSLVSNSPFAVNRKYKPVETVEPRCALIACSNHFDYGDFIKCDSGMVNRLHNLSTLTRMQCLSDGDKRSMTVWLDLSEKLGVSVEVLALWLLRKSVDKFLTVCGYDLNNLGKAKQEVLDGGIKRMRAVPVIAYNRRENRLEETFTTLKEGYRIGVDLGHVAEFINTMFYAYRVMLKNPKLYPGLKENDTIEAFKVKSVFTRVLQANLSDDCPDWLKLKSIDAHQSYRYLTKCSGWEQLKTRYNSAELFKMVMGLLVTNTGYNFPTSLSHYTYLWESLMTDKEYIDSIVADYDFPKADVKPVMSVEPVLF